MKKLILFVIIILCLLPVFTKAEEKQTENEILISILNSIGGEYLEGDISINGLLLNKYLQEEEEINNLGDQIIKSVGLVGKELDASEFNLENGYYIKEKIVDEGYMQINFFGFDEFKNPLTIILSTYSNEDNTEGQTYLYINLIKREHFLENNDIIYRVENIFREYNQPLEITTCVLGSFDGEFNEKTTENKILKAIHRINGIVVDEYKDYLLISYTAYTDLIDKNILAGNDKINLNIALRYNEYDNKTLIWIGTPLIASGY